MNGAFGPRSRCRPLTIREKPPQRSHAATSPPHHTPNATPAPPLRPSRRRPLFSRPGPAPFGLPLFFPASLGTRRNAVSRRPSRHFGPRLVIDLLPTLARKTVFVSLRQTSSRPFVHMDSLGQFTDSTEKSHCVHRVKTAHLIQNQLFIRVSRYGHVLRVIASGAVVSLRHE